jgi:hypothetical protein
LPAEEVSELGLQLIRRAGEIGVSRQWSFLVARLSDALLIAFRRFPGTGPEFLEVAMRLPHERATAYADLDADRWAA